MRIKKFIIHYSLLLILLLAGLLRLWGLSYNPPHLSSDEAALGYNAYSIAKTGRDEHGEFLPIIFKSFGDWKPGLYVYLSVPFVVTLGLTELAVRLPAALSGIFAVYLLYLVVCKLFENKKLATAASLFLAISPWHLQFSRGAWEAGVALTAVLGGIYFFLKAVSGNRNFLLISVVLFSLTLWTYQGAKLSSAIVIGLLVFLWRKQILTAPRWILAKSIVVAAIIVFPVLLSVLQGKTGRLEVYSIFSYERSPETVGEIVGQEGISVGSRQYYLYHSESLNFLRGILGRWFNHYSGRFLFFEGDWTSSRHGVPNAGVILLVDALFLVAGLIALARMGKKKEALFIWFWLLLAPLPAALSRDSVHAVRTLNMLVPLSVILSLGVLQLFDWIKRYRRLTAAIVVFSLAYVANYVYYLDQFWVHAPKKNSQQWQYGYKQMVEKIKTLQKNYEEIIVKQDYTQPYIFFLFYQKYDPVEYQKIAKEVYVPNRFGDVGLVSRLDNVTFRDINWSADRGMSGKLFVVDPIKVLLEDSSDPGQFTLVGEIKFLNGQTGFRLIEIL